MAKTGEYFCKGLRKIKILLAQGFFRRRKLHNRRFIYFKHTKTHEFEKDHKSLYNFVKKAHSMKTGFAKQEEVYQKIQILKVTMCFPFS